MEFIVTSLLQAEPEKRASSGDLLQLPICKLFHCGLMEIVHTQPSFTAVFRQSIVDQIAALRQRPPRPTDKLLTAAECENIPSSYVSATVLEGAVQLPQLSPDKILFEGIVKRQGADRVWKPRYLCIHTDPPALILSITKVSAAQQAIVTPLADLEDVFPVPPKYTGSNAEFVFAVAFKTGKRLSFQAPCEEAMTLWMEQIQSALGI
jgi:protein kinase